jgi:hypothetical protein
MVGLIIRAVICPPLLGILQEDEALMVFTIELVAPVKIAVFFTIMSFPSLIEGENGEPFEIEIEYSVETKGTKITKKRRSLNHPSLVFI